MTRWIEIGALNDIPRLGSRVVRTASGDIAVFRSADDDVFALDDRCPHKGGPLSQGIVHNKRVTCPLHNFVIELASGEAVAPGHGMYARASDQGRERHGVAVASPGNESRRLSVTSRDTGIGLRTGQPREAGMGRAASNLAKLDGLTA